MPYCAKCGKELKKGAKFCPECGAPVSVEVLAKAPEMAKRETVAAPKRIGTTGVIAIVAVIAVAAVGAFLLLRGDEGILPVYSGAQKLGGQSLMGVTYELYSFTGTCEPVYNWYKSQMSAEGWTLGYDGGCTEGYGCSLTYTKGNETAGIEIIASEQAISIYEATFGVDVSSGSKTILLTRGPTEAFE